MTIQISILISVGAIIVGIVTYAIRQEGKLKLLQLELTHMKGFETSCNIEVKKRLELIQEKNDKLQVEIQNSVSLLQTQIVKILQQLTEISTTLKLRKEDRDYS